MLIAVRWSSLVAGMTRQSEGQAGADDGLGTEWSGIRSPVSWALLGLVIEQPGYGYGLVKRFEREYAAMLPIKSDWQIYRSLDGLKEKGLIEEMADETPETTVGPRQPKPHYRVTDSGVRFYADWLLRQVWAPRRHAQLFARQLAVLSARPEAALEIIDRYEAMCLAQTSADPATTYTLGLTPTDERLATRLTREESRLSLAAVLPWLEFARNEFRALATSDRSTDGPA